MHIALVSCVKAKQTQPAPAAELYTSQLFRGLRMYALTHADRWFILSAEHGVLAPEVIVAPYERTLNRMRSLERRAWAERVQEQLRQVLPPASDVLILAGERYREHLVSFLREHGFGVTVPLEGLSIGRQLQRLKQITTEASNVQ